MIRMVLFLIPSEQIRGMAVQFCRACIAVALFQVLLLQGVVMSDDANEAKKEKRVKIKLVEAPALSRFPSMNSDDKLPSARADPSPLSGPPHLQQLHDQCLSSTNKGYHYKVWHFNNITQKEARYGWNRFHGVLGMWQEWLVENDTFVGMLYTMGEPCDSTAREARVMLQCSASTRLHNFTESHTCSHRMILDTPLACFKGAMQVYHVLSPRQLMKWEELDHRFNSDELTYMGLTTRRRALLIEAGVLQKEKKQPKAISPPPPLVPSSSPIESCNCKEENSNFLMHFRALESEILKTVRDYPEVTTKISFLFNLSFANLPFTNRSMSPPLQHAVETDAGVYSHVAHRSNDVVVQAEGRVHDGGGDLLTDDVMDLLVNDLNHNHGDGEGAGNKVQDEEIDAIIEDINQEDIL